MTAQDAPILLVEDNPDDVELTIRAFKDQGIANEVHVASDGAEALEWLLPDDGRAPLVPVVVLLDLKLPRVSGLEVLERLRADPRTRLTPVVVLTTSREERDVVESYRRGINSYVRKPIDFAEFAAAIRAIGLYWLVLNEPPPGAPGSS